LKPTLSSSNQKPINYHLVGNSKTIVRSKNEKDERSSGNIFSKILNCILGFIF